MALNVDYVLRTGSFEIGPASKDIESPQQRALRRYEAVGEEILCSGSDDYTLFLWAPEKQKKSIGN